MFVIFRSVANGWSPKYPRKSELAVFLRTYSKTTNRMATTTRQQPPWHIPGSEDKAQIKIYNSLTKSKVPFIPLDPQGKKVTWYACGPTVYDDSHLGHARNYMTNDIIRRIMSDYFAFDVKFVMNITDVDDKIILRGRQQYLFGKFKKDHQSNEKIVKPALEAYRAYVKKNLPLLPGDLEPVSFTRAKDDAYGHVIRGESLAKNGNPPTDVEAKLKMHINTMSTASQALAADPSSISSEELLSSVEDILLPYLDSIHGSFVDTEDQTMFTTLTRKFENRFNEDMKALNVLEPDVVTRVTEYGQQIVEFVEIVVQNGFGYTTPDGSVYFDINAFEAAGKPYARLEPWNRNDQVLQSDGEGALTKSVEKRSKADFALWKSSKPGEPFWSSPWGKGRPGWHIECSAMASDVLGKTIDIHSGGIDLAFPHHDNELAQSEAYWHDHDHQWVNYFLHMGHLSIQGSKMSKSLKNFTTIRKALERREWNYRSLRIVFVLGSWKDGIEITDDVVSQGSAWEDKVNNFFYKTKMVERRQSQAPNGVANGVKNDTAGDDALLEAHVQSEKQLREALSDSFDTPRAMQVISDLISEYNSTNKSSLTDDTTLIVAHWVTRMVQIFGLDKAPPKAGSIGWSGTDIPEASKDFVYAASEIRDAVRNRANKVIKQQKTAERAKADEKANADKTLKETIENELSPTAVEAIASKHVIPSGQPSEATPYVNILMRFQEAIKNEASNGNDAETYLQLCDELRDVKLWGHKIYLEDAAEEGQPTIVRPLDEGLIKAKAEKEKREAEKKVARIKRDEEQAKKEAEKNEKAKVSHVDMFKTDEFSAWDGEGMPTKDAQGEDVTKSRLKKLKKQWDAQKKLHEEWKAKQKS